MSLGDPQASAAQQPQALHLSNVTTFPFPICSSLACLMVLWPCLEPDVLRDQKVPAPQPRVEATFPACCCVAGNPPSRCVDRLWRTLTRHIHFSFSSLASGSSGAGRRPNLAGGVLHSGGAVGFMLFCQGSAPRAPQVPVGRARTWALGDFMYPPLRISSLLSHSSCEAGPATQHLWTLGTSPA